MDNKYLDQEILIKDLIEGHEKAYTYLMDNYYNKLCVYAGKLTKDPYSGQDIVQNVFLRVWEQRDKLKPHYSIKNYLYRSVYNEFIDQYRKGKQLTLLEEEHIKQLNVIIQEDDGAEIVRLVELVKHEIEQLPNKRKTIFTMAKLEGLTYNEIAEYLNISVRTVEMHMRKAFDTIRENVGDKTDIILFLLFGMHCRDLPA